MALGHRRSPGGKPQKKLTYENVTATVAVAAILVLALFAVGCGSDSNSSSSMSPEDKAAFQHHANAICANGNQEFKSANQQAFGKNPGTPSEVEVERFVKTKLVPIVQAQVKQIRALPVPSGDEAEVNEILDAAQKGVDAVKKDPGLLAQGKPVFQEANELASEYGISACGATHFF
jgi:hypothetical protein